MRLLRVFSLFVLPSAFAIAGPEADVRAAWQKLHLGPGYSWESAEGDPTPAVTTTVGPDGHTHTAGGIARQAAVKGRVLSDGETVTEVTLPSGATGLGLRRADGAAVSRVGHTWYSGEKTRTEMHSPSGKISFSRRTELMAAAGAIAARPDEELKPLLDEMVAYTEKHGEIVGELSARKAGELLGGRRRSIVEAKGTVTFRLEGGLIRQYTVRAAGISQSALIGRATEVPTRLENVTTFNYSGHGGPAVPAEAREKLDQESALKKSPSAVNEAAKTP